jgi:hypothetical protein
MITLLTINLVFTLFFLLYIGVFKRLTFYSGNRFYLLFALVLSAVLPFLSFPSSITPSATNFTVQLPMIEVMANNEVLMHPVVTTSKWIYWMGVGVGLIFLLQALLSVRKLYQQAQRNDQSNYLVNEGTHAFSFFNSIQIGSAIDPSMREMILEHEEVHRRQWHSVDVLLFALARVFCWFNPFVHWAAKEVQLNHEFIADEEVHHRYGSDYQHSLLNQALETKLFPLTNTFFNRPLIKQRIMNMNKSKSGKRSGVLYALIVPAIAASVWITACTNEPGVPESVQQTAVEDVIKPKPQDKVYSPQDELDVMPSFPNGNEELVAYFQENFFYPEDLKSEGVEGRVFIQFTVNEDGSHSDYEAVRVDVTSVGEGGDVDNFDDTRLSEPAIAIIRDMPKWEAGRKDEIPVKVKMVLPVQYSLQ